jgi:RNA polymerase-associated protein CTR9
VYFKHNNINAFKQILNEALDPETIEHIQYADAKKHRIAILNTLAAYNLKEAVKQKEKSKKDDLFAQATMNYNKADKIDIREEITWVGKGTFEPQNIQ